MVASKDKKFSMISGSTISTLTCGSISGCLKNALTLLSSTSTTAKGAAIAESVVTSIRDERNAQGALIVGRKISSRIQLCHVGTVTYAMAIPDSSTALDAKSAPIARSIWMSCNRPSKRVTQLLWPLKA